MIVRDESDCLVDCLKAARPLYDALCVIDTGSTDDTPQIAQSFGARLKFWPWQDDFAAARNQSLALAETDWVAVLDADERISAELCAQVRAAVRQADVGALSCLMDDAQDHGHHRQARLVRFWRRHPDVRFEHRIHEDICGTLMPVLTARGHTLTHLPGTIEHLGYSPQRALAKDKKTRDARLLKMAVDQDPKDLYSWFKLCELARFWRDGPLLTQAATHALPLLLALRPDTPCHFVGELTEHIVHDAALRRIPVDQRLKLVERIAKLYPRDATLAHLWGVQAESRGDVVAAAAAYHRALCAPQGLQNLQRSTTRPRLGLARLALVTGAVDEAQAYIDVALAEAPCDPEALFAHFALAHTANAGWQSWQAYASRHGARPEAAITFSDTAIAAGQADVAHLLWQRYPDFAAHPGVVAAQRRVKDT